MTTSLVESTVETSLIGGNKSNAKSNDEFEHIVLEVFFDLRLFFLMIIYNHLRFLYRLGVALKL